MKTTAVALLILMTLILPFSLTSCSKDEASGELHKKHIVRERGAEAQAQTTIEPLTDEELAELERQANEAMQMLIKSLEESASKPSVLRSVSGDETEIQSTENPNV